MKDFIKEFYYGNIDPQARSIKQSKAVMKEMQTLNETEEYLTAKLKGEEKSKFLDHVNAWSVVNGESNLDSFIVGFRLGAKFTYDTFISDNAPFNPSTLLVKLKDKYVSEGGTYAIGENAWNMLISRAGKEMGKYIEKYIRPPISKMEEEYPATPEDIMLSVSETHLAIKNSKGASYTINRQVSQVDSQ